MDKNVLVPRGDGEVLLQLVETQRLLILEQRLLLELFFEGGEVVGVVEVVPESNETGEEP